MSRLIEPARGPLLGAVKVPGDKSVSHRAALFAPLSGGVSRIRGWLEAEDTGRSLAAVEALGAEVRREGGELSIGPGSFPVVGAVASDAPVVDIDCGNSGTTTRLLMGLLAGRRVRARLDGDASLRSRPMARVVDPLRLMGARIDYEQDEGRLPLVISGAALRGIDYRLPVASAQIKSALLLAGLCAAGETVVAGGGASRDHTEKMLAAMGADLRTGDDRCTLQPGRPLTLLDMTVPGDPSSAAFLLAAAVLVPGSGIEIRDLMFNPTRARFLDVLDDMAAGLEIRPQTGRAVEPVGEVRAHHGALRACEISGPGIPAMIDELPLLAALAGRAEGVTRIRDAKELRYKESDRLETTAAGLRALGVEVTVHEDGLDIVGNPDGYPTRQAAAVSTRGDHRIAMAFAVAALASRGGVLLDDDACVAVSFPDFFAILEDLQCGGTET